MAYLANITTYNGGKWIDNILFPLIKALISSYNNEFLQSSLIYHLDWHQIRLYLVCYHFQYDIKKMKEQKIMSLPIHS